MLLHFFTYLFTYLLLCSFSLAFRDNLDAAVTSPELVAQTERLTLVLETRYVDDSLIPGKPEQLFPSFRRIGSRILTSTKTFFEMIIFLKVNEM